MGWCLKPRLKVINQAVSGPEEQGTDNDSGADKIETRRT